jgi:hypothetical protein
MFANRATRLPLNIDSVSLQRNDLITANTNETRY